MRHSVKLIAKTVPVVEGIEDAQGLIAYCARVSNPSNQWNEASAPGLLDYCRRHKHWSVFQMANAVLEIEAPRDIARQFTRHESMVVIEHDTGYSVTPDGIDLKAGGVQEFSQRYAEVVETTDREMRRQDDKNRQSSHDDLPEAAKRFWEDSAAEVVADAQALYKDALGAGVAKECARVVLPEGLVMSRLYVNANLRSWMTYLDVRLGPGTQKEHRVLADAIKGVLMAEFPMLFAEVAQ
jgi:thymidylate synthase (FAD)